MRIIRDLEHCPRDLKGAVMALGNFDGLHSGHRAIIEACTSIAKEAGRPAAIMTFEPHPREFFGGKNAPMRLHTLHDKLVALREWKALDAVFLARFNARFASLSPQQFVHEVLKGQLSVYHVVTGFNFAFGKGREGSTEMLAGAARADGFGFTAVMPVKDASGEAISSSRIRTLLAEGKTLDAAKLLGRPYAMSGRVQRGEGRGKTLGFPTANLPLVRLFVPKLGIYAARATLGKKTYNAVASIGTKPTFSPVAPLLEVHCFDFSRACYGERMYVELLDFIRDEEKFASADALRTRMEEDCRATKAILNAGGRRHAGSR